MIVLAASFTCWWKDIVYKYKYCLFCTQFNPFADDIDKLSHCQISWNKVPEICSISLYGGEEKISITKY